MATYRAKKRSGRAVDYTGRRFGYLTAVRFTGRVSKHQSRIWVLRCICGKEIRRPGTAFAGPIGTRSCGCMAKEAQGNATRSHSMSGHRAYHSWRHAKRIGVCKRWEKFENFWADMGPAWKPGVELRRNNTEAIYTKRNCRWANSARVRASAFRELSK
jgi:hypothetical protein